MRYILILFVAVSSFFSASKCQCPFNQEYLSCGRCDQICNKEPSGCAAVCGPEGCYCRQGYYRVNDSNTSDCVLPSSCPGQQYCRINEVYNECGGCDQICNEGPIFCTQDCSRPGCYCAPGYVRAFRGNSICIPPSNCPARNAEVESSPVVQNTGPFRPAPVQNRPVVQNIGPARPAQVESSPVVQNTGQQYCRINEVYNECGGCDQTCNEEPIFCTQDCSRPGCYCAPGYVRAFRGNSICIPPVNCPARPAEVESSPMVLNAGYKCGANEVYNQCGVGFQCENYCGRGPNACAYCQPGCYCRAGYIRDGPEDNAKCIPENQCPRAQDLSVGSIQSTGYQCGANEVFNQCGVGWQCEDYCGRGANACAYCQPGCYCRPGYIRDGPEESAVCIPKDQCPRIQDIGTDEIQSASYQCGANEVYQQCGVGFECENYCGRGPNACAYCQPGCYCRSGYIRDGPEDNAVCIPENQCPTIQVADSSFGQLDIIQCGANEVYDQCGVGEQCENYCGRGPIACASYCQPGCYCRPGYIRDGPEDTAVCIPENQCPTIQYESFPLIQSDSPSSPVLSSSVDESSRYQCRPNEVFNQCGVGPQCEDYCGREPNACAYCQPGCYCKDGYVRAGPSNSTRCVPKKQCPVKQKCLKNEVYSDCGSACPASCDRRQVVCTKQCVQGCFCKKGYIKEHDDTQYVRYNCIEVCPVQ